MWRVTYEMSCDGGPKHQASFRASWLLMGGSTGRRIGTQAADPLGRWVSGLAVVCCSRFDWVSEGECDVGRTRPPAVAKVMCQIGAGGTLSDLLANLWRRVRGFCTLRFSNCTVYCSIQMIDEIRFGVHFYMRNTVYHRRCDNCSTVRSVHSSFILKTRGMTNIVVSTGFVPCYFSTNRLQFHHFSMRWLDINRFGFKYLSLQIFPAQLCTFRDNFNSPTFQPF